MGLIGDVTVPTAEFGCEASWRAGWSRVGQRHGVSAGQGLLGHGPPIPVPGIRLVFRPIGGKTLKVDALGLVGQAGQI